MVKLKLKEKEKEGLTEEEQEIAMARKLEILILPYLQRNIAFFYGAANFPEKAKAYRTDMDKVVFEKQMQRGEISPTSCRALCRMVVEILQENGIFAETISCDTDIFRHTDVLLHTKEGRSYIINYLEDMERIQTGMKTPDFASEPYYKRRYEKFEGKLTPDGKSVEGVTFLDESILDKIDGNLSYKKQGMYMDAVIEQIRKEFADFRNVMAENEWANEEYQMEKANISQEEKEKRRKEIYDKYANMTKEEELEAKLDWIFESFNDRMNINGYTDFVMYYNQLLFKGVFTEEERSKIVRYSGMVDRNNIPAGSDLESILDLENPENEKRARFCLIKIGNKGYLFSRKPNEYKKISEEEIEELSLYAKLDEVQTPSDLVLRLCDLGNATPLLFHPLGSKILNERADLIPQNLLQEERTKEIEKLVSLIKCTDEPVTSILIPYPDGTTKYMYITEDDEFSVKEDKTETIYHYDEEKDDFDIDER